MQAFIFFMTLFVAGYSAFAENSSDKVSFHELTGQEKIYFTTNSFDIKSRSTFFSYGYELNLEVFNPDDYDLVSIPNVAIDLVSGGAFYSNYELISVEAVKQMIVHDRKKYWALEGHACASVSVSLTQNWYLTFDRLVGTNFILCLDQNGKMKLAYNGNQPSLSKELKRTVDKMDIDLNVDLRMP